MKLYNEEVIDYMLFPDRRQPEDWTVEAVASNGDCYTVTFSGPSAERLATEYANFKNGDI